MKLRIGSVVVGFLSFALSLAAQTASSVSSSFQVPPLIQFSNVATDQGGSSLSGEVSITFSLYAAQQGGEPLWTETQNNIQLDPTGHYSVQLGITKPNGVPTTLFTSGEARWLGVKIAEQGEQPRVLLLSVPYALKAGDAATIGGLPPSAFVLAAPALSSAALDANATPQTSTPPPTGGPVTGTGTVNYLPLWDSTSDIVSSVIFQSGTGTGAKIGIGTTTPATTLDIKGGSTVRGILSLPATGTATASKGANSQPLTLTASAYNSSTPAAVNQTFRWQAEAVNDKPTPSGTLNLLFGEGTAIPAETGLHIASNGQITFAAGQTFPGAAGSGTVTSVATGLGLTGGPIISSGTLSIDTTKIPQLGAANTFTANQTVNGGSLTLISPGNSIVANTTGTSTAAVEANAKGSGVNYGVYASTGSPTGYGVEGVNSAITGTTAGIYGITQSTTGYGVEGVDNATSDGTAGFFKVSSSSATILQGSNGGTSEFTVDAEGDVYAAGAVSGSSFRVDNQVFAYGSSVKANAFLGFGGGGSPGGGPSDDTAVGFGALVDDAGSGGNTAVGAVALEYNTTGSNITAIGVNAGYLADGSYGTGSNNTALGAGAGFSTGSWSNATVIGANAVVSESNALVLGSIAGSTACDPACPGTNVGIGTSAPGHLLDVAGLGAFDATGKNNGTGIDLTFGLSAGEGISSSRTAGPNQYGIDLWTDFNRRISIEQFGNVGIGTTSPDSLLTVNGSADKPSGGSWGTFSDARLKTVNGGFTSGLSQVMKIHPVHYRYKPDNAMGIRDMDEHIGVVAQEVKQVIPEAVTENSKGYLLVNNDPIIWTMLNAIKEQQREIRALRSELRLTQQTLRKVKAQLTATQSPLMAAK
jgi:endosialidase-like protein